MVKLRVKNNYIFYDENNKIIDNKNVERIEQCFCEMFIKENDVVLELGARYGTSSCAINSKLKNKSNQVSVEPDDSVWNALENNKKRNNCNFHIVKGFISNKKINLSNLESGYASRYELNNNSLIPCFTLNEIKKKYNLNFDVLVADCEGYLEEFFDQNPELYNDLRLLILEEDCKEICNYEKLELNFKKHGFKTIASHSFGTKRIVLSKTN